MVERLTEQSTFQHDKFLKRDLEQFAREDSRSVSSVIRIVLQAYARSRKAKKLA